MKSPVPNGIPDSIGNGYSGCLPDDVKKMTPEELVDAVNRMFRVSGYKFGPNDSYCGTFLLHDELADAFRGRN